MEKKKKSRVLVPAGKPASRAVRLLMALLFTVAAGAWLTATPDRAAAQEEAVDPNLADSDGYVPIYSVCYPENEFVGEGGGLYDLAALYVPYDNGYAIEGYILLNECALERYGAGPNDIQHVIDHELGHAAGLPDSDDPSSIMYPYYEATGT
jgi:hypothetical protein